MEIAENYSKEVCMNVRDERVIFFTIWFTSNEPTELITR